MRAVARLVLIYFAATPLMRGLSAVGLICILAGGVGRAFVPAGSLAAAMRGPDAGALALVALALPWNGLLLLIAATTLMPGIVERLAASRSISVLPCGRPRLLVSTLVTAALLSLIVAAEATVAFLDFAIPVSYGTVFYRTLFMAFVDFGLIYAAVWLVTKTNGIWRLAGVLWIIVSITIPLRYVGGIPPISPLEALGLASWLVLGTLLLSGGRGRHVLHDLSARARAIVQPLTPTTGYRSGRELDLVLGVTQPWIIAFGQIVPIAVMAVLIREPRIWLVVLMVFSAMAGAVACRAASRSRQLWLRVGLTRGEIVRRVERSFWRYNASSLIVLLAVYVTLAALNGFTTAEIGHGVVLLALGCAACTYLGLMITRELGWFESSLCILTLIALVVAAVSAMRGALLTAAELEILLLGLAILYRRLALSRWAALDWMCCRPEVGVRAAG